MTTIAPGAARMRAWSKLLRIAAGLMLFGSGAASAASAQTTFNVTALVVDSCAVSATDLAFGTYSPTSITDKTGTSTISVTCSLGTLYTIGLNNGTHASGSTRRMAAGLVMLTYQLYRNVGATLVFGSAADTLGVAGVGTGVAIPTVVYGVIPNSQNVNAGSYSDVITVTIDY